jgi:Spy/CpxP family protein refolding chaperone
MKKISQGVLAIALSAGMFGAMSGSALAQNGSDQQQGPPQQQDGMRRGPGGEGRRGMPSPEERLRRMTAELNLTADQQAKIKTIMETEKSKMDALRDDTSVEGEEKREKAMQIRKDSQTGIRAVLTAEQQAKWDKQMEEMRNRRGGDRPGPPPPPPSDK